MASHDHSPGAPEEHKHDCHDCGHDHDEHKEHDDNGHEGCNHENSDNRLVTVSLAVSGVLVGAGLLLRWLQIGPAMLSIGVFLAAIGVGGWMLLPGAWAAVRGLRPNISSLMVIAVVGASVIGDWAEAATVVFLFGVAEWLEGWADRRAQRAVEALLEIAPKTATVKRDGQFTDVPVEDVRVDETVAVKSGMNIPLDGEVLAGESAVNQAPITGESVPVDKIPGDTVFAGTVNGEGSLEIRVTKEADDTTLARIIRLVKEAQEQKAPTQRFVDVFARYYTPAVTVGALLVFLIPPLFLGGDWSAWLYRACVLLIIACPCALVISTPVSIVAGLTALAKRGVLVKGGAHLESIAKLKALAVDKTGTITEGKPQVQSVEPFNQKSEQEILRIAAAIDDHSSHPLAKAVVDHAKKQGVAFPRAENYQARSGRGAEGVVEGHAYFVGNHRFTHELGVCSEEIERRAAIIESKGQSVVVVGHRPHGDCKGEVFGILAVVTPSGPMPQKPSAHCTLPVSNRS